MGNLIGKTAPDFTAAAVMPDNSFNDSFSLQDLRGKYVLLFFYPLDFTFVCPTEILEFDRKLEQFKEKGVEVVGVSVDSKRSHWAWKNTKVEDGGIGNIRYPLVSDIHKTISAEFGVLQDDGTALRGTFLIDKQGVVKHAVLNHPHLGRNIDEELRTVDALQYTEQHGEVCPVNWQQGDDAMKETHEAVASYLKKHNA